MGHSTFCEWKGHATYWNVKGGGPKRKIWSYEQPTGKFGPIAGYLSFYAHPPFQCFVDDEEALQQPGDFYGGYTFNCPYSNGSKHRPLASSDAFSVHPAALQRNSQMCVNLWIDEEISIQDHRNGLPLLRPITAQRKASFT